MLDCWLSGLNELILDDRCFAQNCSKLGLSCSIEHSLQLKRWSPSFMKPSVKINTHRGLFELVIDRIAPNRKIGC